MKTVLKLSKSSPNSQVMLFAHLQQSGKVLFACQVPKVQHTQKKFTQLQYNLTGVRLLSFCLLRALLLVQRSNGLFMCAHAWKEMQMAQMRLLKVWEMQPKSQMLQRSYSGLKNLLTTKSEMHHDQNNLG